ncbi:serine/threonine protein kinase [Labilithrix luteola]|nr:serine/threonine-protein kinase [Labilithrix luteola]
MTQGDVGQDPLVGATIAGKYKVVKQLGEGGMGCVYLAEQQLGSTARKVALKTLHKHLSHDPSIQARFDREAGTVAALEHPNTIQVFDYGKMDDGTLYIVMEFVQGRSVADILEKDGPMQPSRVEHIMKQVCGSLEEAHGHGIIHRDLKPDNVVLCERAGQKDWVEVLDFGIAKRSNEHDPNEAKLTQQGMVLGTPPYMSPEQFTGQPIDVRSDIYALGVMAYEMLTARLPFEANTAWEWASKHMTEMPTPLERQPLGSNVPAAQKAAIMKALAKNKEERFVSVREFIDAFTGNTPVSAGASAQAAAGKTEAVPAMDAAAPMSGGVGRAKTEMAQPMMGGGPPAGSSPQYGNAPSPSFAGPPPASPNAPAKKGGNGLVIGLGVLAVLLLGGGGIAMLSGKKSTPTPVTTSLTDMNATATATASATTAAATPTDTASAAPLEAPTVAAPLETPQAKAATQPAGGGATKPGGNKTPTPVPTPQPTQKVDPPVCIQARTAKVSKQPAAIVNSLEAKCRAAGGTP